MWLVIWTERPKGPPIQGWTVSHDMKALLFKLKDLSMNRNIGAEDIGIFPFDSMVSAKKKEELLADAGVERKTATIFPLLYDEHEMDCHCGLCDLAGRAWKCIVYPSGVHRTNAIDHTLMTFYAPSSDVSYQNAKDWIEKHGYTLIEDF